jgi:hypothetical protein
LIANGLRYENWLFAAVFSMVIAYREIVRWRQRRMNSRSVTLTVGALGLISAFPLVWMTTSYYVLGDWLPVFQDLQVTQGTLASMLRFPRLALVSFPLEAALAVAGMIWLLRSDRRTSFRLYLLVLIATTFVFAVVCGRQLPQIGTRHARVLLPYVVLLLPYAGLTLDRLLRASRERRVACVAAGCLLFLAAGGFDLLRVFNYPDRFPKDALYAGWTIRGLQSIRSLPGNGRILIERGKDWGDLAIVALANRPERFVLLHEGTLGSACQEGFQTDACRGSVQEGSFDLVILSSPERIQSFQDTYSSRWSQIKRYHIFDMQFSQPLQPSMRTGWAGEEMVEQPREPR